MVTPTAPRRRLPIGIQNLLDNLDDPAIAREMRCGAVSRARWRHCASVFYSHLAALAVGQVQRRRLSAPQSPGQHAASWA